MNTQKLKANLLKQHPANMRAVTPSDSADLDKYGILYVKSGGDVKVDLTEEGTGITLNLEDESFLPLNIKRVYATGTDATDIYVCW